MPISYTVPGSGGGYKPSTSTSVRKMGNIAPMPARTSAAAPKYTSPVLKAGNIATEHSAPGGATYNPNTGGAKAGLTPGPGNAALSGFGAGVNSGFASRYKDDSADLLQRHPEVILADVMKSMGVNPNGAAYGMAADYAPLVNALYMAAGNQPGSQADATNWAAKFFGGLQGQMGQNLDAGQMFRNILSGGGGDKSAIFNYIAGIQDPMAQVSATNDLINSVAQYGMPLVMQKALQNNEAKLERQYYQTAASQGQKQMPNYYDFLNQQADHSMLSAYTG